MAGNSQMPRTAKSRAGARPRSGRTQGRNGSAPSDVMHDEIALDALAGHAGYAVRRFQIWIFQDFIRTLGAVDIRPTQYSVMTVIGANPGLSQMAVAKRLGIERARLVHLLGQPRTSRPRQPRQIGHRPALPRLAPDRARQDRAGAVQAARRRT